MRLFLNESMLEAHAFFQSGLGIHLLGVQHRVGDAPAICGSHSLRQLKAMLGIRIRVARPEIRQSLSLHSFEMSGTATSQFNPLTTTGDWLENISSTD